MRDLNEYGPSKAPDPRAIVPLPSEIDPFHSACALRVGMRVLLLGFSIFERIMTRGQRLTFLGIAVVIAVVAVILLAGGGDETDKRAKSAPTATPTPTADRRRGRGDADADADADRRSRPRSSRPAR